VQFNVQRAPAAIAKEDLSSLMAGLFQSQRVSFDTIRKGTPGLLGADQAPWCFDVGELCWTKTLWHGSMPESAGNALRR
jgi:hypothetical protein